MEFPINLLHNYIGIPVMTILGIDTVWRYQKNHNQTNLQLGLSCLYAAVALMSFGLPALFTHDSRLLSIGTFIGDCALATAFLSLWFICIRAFFGTKPLLAKIANVVTIALTLACFAEAIHRNFTPPYSTEAVQSAANGLAIVYRDSLLYAVLSGLNSIAVLLIGIYFWRQGQFAPTKGQATKIRGFAFGLLLVAVSYVIVPGLEVANQAVVTGGLFTAAFIVIGSTYITGNRIDKRTKATDQQTT